jgi:hypothetical protein
MHFKEYALEFNIFQDIDAKTKSIRNSEFRKVLAQSPENSTKIEKLPISVESS